MMPIKSGRFSVYLKIFVAFRYPIYTVLDATNGIGLTCNCLAVDSVRATSH
jgi:hypothetical protein